MQVNFNKIHEIFIFYTIYFKYTITIMWSMIVGINDEAINEEILEITLDSDEKQVKSTPLQEITFEEFVKVGNSESSESSTTSNIISGNVLSLNLSSTT